MSEAVLRSLVWLDYRLALIFTVIVPLVLLVWSIMQRMEAMQLLITIYWKVASLLAITVYLLIAGMPIGFLTGPIALLLIIAGLWFWADLNEDIADMAISRPLRLVFNAWRWAVTVYGGAAVLLSLMFVRCGLLSGGDLLADNRCRAWLDAPWGYKQLFHANTSAGFLGFLAVVALVVYVLFLAYFVFVRLGRSGRSATGQ